MDDIVPELLKKIQNDFQKKYDKDSEIAELLKKLETGTANHAEAYTYANKVGSILADAYANNLSSAVLPEGKMWYNIGNRVITPTMEKNYSYISEYVNQVQSQLNKAAGIGIKPVNVPLNADRIRGIINRLSSEDDFDKVAWILKEPVKTAAKSIVDDSIKANAEFHGKSGMKPKIIRKTSGKCCKWCTGIAGIYNYPEVPDEIYHRHENCDCVVEYVPGNGKRQNVHTKQWRSETERDKIEARKNIGVNRATRKFRTANFRTANMSNEEFARGKKLWQQYDELPLSMAEKEQVYEEFDNNLSVEERESCMVRKAIGDYWYRAINLGHNQYKIIGKEPIEPYEDIVDEVLSEMFGRNWREYL